MLGDERTMFIHGVGSHGLFRDVSFATDLRLNLISTKTLCIEKLFLILFINTKALVIDKNIFHNKHKAPHEFIACIVKMNTKDNLCNISCLLCSNKRVNLYYLYYIDNINSLVYYKNNNDKLNLY
jgi:hypothetical protein